MSERGIQQAMFLQDDEGRIFISVAEHVADAGEAFIWRKIHETPPRQSWQEAFDDMTEFKRSQQEDANGEEQEKQAGGENANQRAV